MNLADVLRGWRHHEELSVMQAANRLNITINIYRAIERGDGIQGVYLASLISWLIAQR